MSKRCLQSMGVGLLLVSGVAFCQTPAAPLSFEVASIKPAPPIDPTKVQSGQPIHVGMKIDASRVDIGYFSVSALIMKAYNVKLYQISGPDWLTSMGAQMAAQRFDIVAKMPAGATKEQVPEMLRTLLAERFKLAVHRDSKEHSVYALVVGKGGLKLKESEPDAVAPTVSADGGPAPPPSSGSNQITVNPNKGGAGAEVSDGEGGKQKMSMSPDGKSMHFEMSRMSMARFTEMLTPMVDRPVVDMTGLKGNFQVSLDVPMEDLMAIAKRAGMAQGMGGGGDSGKAPAEAASDPSGGSIFTSVQQMGLKLEGRKTAIENIVVDHVEKTPTEN